VRDYFHVGVIGYGASVRPIFDGPLAGRDLVPLSEVAAQPARVEERTRVGSAGSRSVKFPTWFAAKAYGDTPMSGALNRASAVLSSWLAEHPGSFPPIVLNITDGESTDGDPSVAAAKLRGLTSADGNVMLFNLHLSSDHSDPIVFPAVPDGLPDDYAHLLFEMSSPLPEDMRAAASRQSLTLEGSSRGFAFNADITSIVQFLDVGTQVMDLR
jgi:hypothetical protein